MKEWMTAAEIAEAQLAGLPATKRGINIMIQRERWNAYSASARPRGNATEYHVRLLPMAARLDFISRSLPETEQAAPVAADELETLGATSLFRRDARAAIVRAADKLHGIAGLWFTTTDHYFCQLFADRRAPVPEWVYGVVTKISPRSIARWRQAIQHGSRDRLAGDPSKNRAGTGVLDTAEDGRVKKFCLALVAKNPHLAAKHVRATVAAEFGETISVVSARTGEVKDTALPPLRSFQHALKSWKHEHRHELTYLTDPDGYRSKVQFAATGATTAARLNELWEIDASPADVMTKDGRHSIYACVDIYSRRLKILVSKTPTSAAVGLLVRNCLLDWGVPERIKTDNGSDFTSYQTRRLFAELDIEQEICPPFSPHKKGVVERHIRTFQHDLARMMPGFIGHSVADRKVIENRKAFSRRLGADDESLFGVDLTAAELQDYATRWCDEAYAHAPHEGLRRKTPFQRAAEYTGDIRRIRDTQSLDVLLAPVPGKDGLRTVTKSGIRLNGEVYWIGTVLPGTTVFCRMDPADLGRLYVFSAEGSEFLGHAVCPAIAGLDPAETAARVKAERERMIRDGVADLRREARKIGPRTVLEANLRGGTGAELLAFPAPAAEHSTGSLEAASNAVAGITAEPLSGDAAAIFEQEKREQAAAKAANVVRITPKAGEETMQDRFRRARDLEARTDLSETDARWLKGYQAGSEYQAMQLLYEDFGDRVFGGPKKERAGGDRRVE